MEREDFAEFFLASAGAGGAFVGLLFVAISIGPQRTFGGPAITGAPRQHLAEAAFLVLVNGFVVSSIALIPGSAVGWVALVLGVWGVFAAGRLGWVFARFHRDGSSPHTSWRNVLRTVSVSLTAAVIFAIEALFGLLFALEPTDTDALRGLAFVIVGLYVLGILRAWILLGDPQHGWSGWLNPLQDLEATEEMVEQQEVSGIDTGQYANRQLNETAAIHRNPAP
jgi:hypothetical protein